MHQLIGFLLNTVIIFPVVVAFAAEAYPTKGVRIIVPLAAGGSTDLLARSVVQGLNEAWKQSVIVDNRAGGGGIVGSEHVFKSSADGYTLLLGTVTTHAVAATLYSKLPYDIQRDLVGKNICTSLILKFIIARRPSADVSQSASASPPATLI